MKKAYILTLFALLVLDATAAQYVSLSNGLMVQLLSDNKATVIKKAERYSGDIVIPATFKYNDATYQITKISNEAFINCSDMTSVTIPETVTAIGLRGFKNCTGLTSLTLPASLNTMESEAFAGCTALASVNILSTFSSLGTKPFSGCTSLKEVSFNGNSTANLFNGCTGIEKAVIGDHVKTIGNNTFYECTNLTSLTIGKSVETIGAQAFIYCHQLTSVNFPQSLTTIGDQAFRGCDALTAINIPEGVTTIGSSAFATCISATTVSIPRSLKTIGKSAFYDDNALTAVHITDLTAWCNIAFASFDSNPLCYAKHLYKNGQEITDLVIPDGLTSINNYAFQGGQGFTSLTIPTSVTIIGESVFKGCTCIGQLVIPEGVTSIGKMAFMSCIGITSISMPGTLKSIAERAFEECNSLKAVHITDVAAWCDVDFGESYSNPLQKARRLYMNKRQVNELKVPEGVKIIKPYAFAYCYSLESVVLPSTLEQIGRNAFYDCPAITEIICRAVEPPFIDYYSISKLSNMYLYVRESSIDAYKDSYWVHTKGILPLPDNLPAKCAKPTIDYVDGRFVFSSTTDGVEFVSLIEDANAYPHEGNQYPLTPTYEVRVFCRLKGCDDSETTVATYTWENGTPKITVIK